MKLISKIDAITRKLKFYFTGVVCKNGHIDKRYVSTGGCCQCAINQANKSYVKSSDIIKENLRLEYSKNPEKFKNKVALRKRNNPEKIKQEKRIEYVKHKQSYLDRANKWGINNIESKRKSGRKWAKNNPGHARAIVVARRAAKLNRTPSWLTNDDKNIIKDMYAIASRVSKETGTKRHVDHVIPLQGELVSGLHVPDNLQLLTAKANLTKGNYFAVN